MGKLNKITRTFRSFYTGRYAIVTNTATAGGMGFLADSLSQVVETQVSDKSWDMQRTKNMTILSTAFGPIAHCWYGFLDGKFPGKSRRAVSSKVVLDLISGPFWYMIYFGGLCKLRNESFEQSVIEYTTKVPLLLSADITMWPFLQSLNFLLVPPHYRIIGLKFNDLLMGILYSHLVNNHYSFKQLLDWVKSKC